MSGEVIKWASCLNPTCSSHAAGRKVAVKLNRSDRAYQRCDDCGLEAKFTTDVGSKRYLKTLGFEVANHGESPPAKPASPMPTPAPEKSSESPPIAAPAPVKKSGGWL